MTKEEKFTKVITGPPDPRVQRMHLSTLYIINRLSNPYFTLENIQSAKSALDELGNDLNDFLYSFKDD